MLPLEQIIKSNEHICISVLFSAKQVSASTNLEGCDMICVFASYQKKTFFGGDEEIGSKCAETMTRSSQNICYGVDTGHSVL